MFHRQQLVSVNVYDHGHLQAEHEQVLEENSVMFGDLKSARETIDELKQENGI